MQASVTITVSTVSDETTVHIRPSCGSYAGGELFCLLSYPTFVGSCVFLEERVCLALRWVCGVGIVKQILNAEEKLLDGDCWLPALILVQDTQTDGAGREDVWMKEFHIKFALGRL